MSRLKVTAVMWLYSVLVLGSYLRMKLTEVTGVNEVRNSRHVVYSVLVLIRTHRIFDRCGGKMHQPSQEHYLPPQVNTDLPGPRVKTRGYKDVTTTWFK